MLVLLLAGALLALGGCVSRSMAQNAAASQAQLPRLRAISKPVGVIFGADDPYLNRGVAQDFAALFPNSSLDLIEQAGHCVQLDGPQAVARAMRERLKR